MKFIKDLFFTLMLAIDINTGKEDCILDGEPNDINEYNRHIG